MARAHRTSYVRENANGSVCPWKGVASYYDAVIGGKVVGNGGWTYHKPSPAAAAGIKDYVPFYKRFAIFGKIKIER